MKRNKQIGCVSVLFFLAFVALAASTLPAKAVQTYWQADPTTPAPWDDPLNWTVRVPIAGDEAYVDSGGTALISADFSAFRVYASRFGAGQIEQTGGNGTISADLSIGIAGSYTQYGGTNTVLSELRISGSHVLSGTYNLVAGHLSATTEYIGSVASGTVTWHEGFFNQSGGVNEVGYLYITERGGFSLSGGTLSIANSANIRGSFEFTDAAWTLNINGGIANFGRATIKGAGSASFSSAADTLTIFPAGFDTGSFASYNPLGLVGFAGGTIVINAGESCSGQGRIEDLVDNMGTIRASGGPLSFYGGLSVRGAGSVAPSAGEAINVFFNNGATGVLEGAGSISATRESVGDNGIGFFTQSGGTNTVSDNLNLGYYSDSAGTYVQTGGTNTVFGNLVLGNGTGSTGTYNLNGGQLSATIQYIGFFAGLLSGATTGIFTQAGGTNNVTATLCLGYGGGSSGTYNLSTGQLTAVSEYIGYDHYGTGAFIQSGGTNTVSNDLYLGYYILSTGSYNLSRGQLSAAREHIGGISGGTGTFVHSGGTNTVSEMFLLGEGPNSRGTYNLTDGQLSAQEEHIGQAGVGIFTQDDGTNTVTNHIYLGYNSGSSGTYNLGGGQLSVPTLYIGYTGAGDFTQDGGINTVSSNLYLAYNPASHGTYTLNGGLLSATNQYIGYVIFGSGAPGTFTQTGGTNVADGALNIGLLYGVGSYNLGGGALKPHDLIIGNNGTLNVTNSNASIIIGGNFTIKPLAKFSTVPGATIHMTGSSFDNQSSSMANISGLENTTFIFEKAVGVHDTFEAASYDYGLVERGFENNFVIDGLTLSNTYFSTLQLVDANWNYTANGPRTIGEALYVRTLTLFSHSTLDLNGYHLYAMEFYNYGGAVINGEVMAMEEYYIPEPGTIALLAPAILGIAGMAAARRRKLNR